MNDKVYKGSGKLGKRVRKATENSWQAVTCHNKDFLKILIQMSYRINGFLNFKCQ